MADVVTIADGIVIARCQPADVAAMTAVAAAATVTLVETDEPSSLPAPFIGVSSVAAAIKEIVDAVATAPEAAQVLAQLLHGDDQSVEAGLVAESAAYSMLLAGPEFLTWRATHPSHPPVDPSEPAAIVERTDDVLTITLNRPDRHNAFGRWVRDATCDALDLAILDPSIKAVLLRGAGPSFCSGGDLAEFGTQPDVALAHLIRIDRSVGQRLHQLADRVTVELHGACIGAGMELPAFAKRVVARPGTWFALPELSMGLIPGAGGTVSLPRRIGRWRTAWLAMSGARLDLDTALQWGLVDDVIN